MCVFVVLPTLVFYVLGSDMFSERALFNLDYPAFALAAIILGFRRWTIVAGLVVATIADAISSSAAANALAFREIWGQLPSLVASSPVALMLALVILLTVCFAWQLLLRFAWEFKSTAEERGSRAILLSLLVSISLIISADIANGTNSAFVGSSTTVIEANIATSGIRALVGSVSRGLDDVKKGKDPKDGVSYVPSASVALNQFLALGRSGPRPDILIVVVESWGQLRDSVLADSLLAPITAVVGARKLTMKNGVVIAHGATFSGEVRELCHTDLETSGLPQAAIAACLPQQARLAGYVTTAFHGFSGQFYQRNRLYPVLGFDTSLFARDVKGFVKIENCGALFRGVCDDTMALAISRYLQNKSRTPSRQFIYWMTLSGHLPATASAARRDGAPCPSTPPLPLAVCRWFQVTRHALRSTALIIERASKPMVAVVVGDHPPSFAQAAARELFVAHVVPFAVVYPADDRASTAIPAKKPGAGPRRMTVRGRAKRASN